MAGDEERLTWSDIEDVAAEARSRLVAFEFLDLTLKSQQNFASWTLIWVIGVFAGFAILLLIPRLLSPQAAEAALAAVLVSGGTAAGIAATRFQLVELARRGRDIAGKLEPELYSVEAVLREAPVDERSLALSQSEPYLTQTRRTSEERRYSEPRSSGESAL